MPLRSFLGHLEHDPTASRLADEGGSAFVSQSLRPFLLAALADRDVRTPTVVVAGDDRSARDLAADLRAWLRPRPVRFYPSRGVAYESHLTPPPHLVGLRVAAVDSLLETPAGSEQPVIVVSAVALSEKVPDPALRPHGFTLRVGELLDLDEAATDLVAAGYERVDQVDDRGQFAVRGGLLDVYPATEERAIRVDLFDDEIESLRWFSTFTQRSLGEAEVVEIAPAAELAAEHRELAEIAALEHPDERPDVAELLPVGDFRELLDLLPDHAELVLAADEEVEPALRDHWDDVCAAFHDADARSLYVNPDGIVAALEARAPLRLSSISGDQELEFRAQAADFSARNLREAEPELEKLVRSGYTALKRDGGGPRVRGGDAARRLHRPGDQARRRPRAPAHPPAQGVHAPDPQGQGPAALVHRPAHGRLHRSRGPRRRALRRLRHEDRQRHHARLPEPRVPGRRQGLHAGRPAREDLALRRRRRQRPDPLQARRHALGQDQGPRAQGRAGARGRAAQPLRRAQAPARARLRARLGLAARVRGRVPVPRDARPARGDRVREGRHGVRAPDGPPDLRRRGLRQDGGRAARRVQGRQRRQAGADAGADDHPRPAALRHLHRAPARLPVHDRARLALPPAGRAARRGQGVRRGQDRHPHRHPPAALARRAREGPRAADRRRGAALRRQAEGAAAPDEAQGRRDLHERHADPAHPAD